MSSFLERSKLSGRLTVALGTLTNSIKLSSSTKFVSDEDESNLLDFDELLSIVDELSLDDVEDWAAEMEWLLDEESLEYVTEGGDRVSRERVEELLGNKVADADDEIDGLTEKMLDRDIDVADWEVEVAQILVPLLLCMFAFGRAADRMTDDDLDYVRDRARVQLEYLRQFSTDIIKGTQSAAQIEARIKLYTQDDRIAESEGRETLHLVDEWPYYCNVLGIPASGESCQQCIDLTGRGWVERDTLTPLGMRTCVWNDYCHFEYARELPE